MPDENLYHRVEILESQVQRLLNQILALEREIAKEPEDE